jgi:hypothetical protein
VTTMLSPTAIRMTNARTICGALGGRWYGRYGLTFCPAHLNNKTSALSLSDGSDGKLLVYCHTGCSGADVLVALRAQGLLEGHSDWKPNPQVAEQRKIEKEADDRRRVNLARRCWSEAGSNSGTLAERYLRNRGIACPLPPTLKFHPECCHGPTGTKVPAMVGAVSIGRKIVGVHRTNLAEPGVKAFDNAKMMLGPCAGGAVRLAEPDGDHICIGEGIETCLSAMQLGLGPAWACLSTSGLKRVHLPDQVRRVTILADSDDAGVAAAHEIQHRLSLTGRRATIAEPVGFNDFNDLLGV